MKQKTFNIYTFGCRVNEAETMALEKELEIRGWIKNTIEPSIYIVNSCAVTGKAEKEVRQHISSIKRSYPGTRIIVTGCAATHWLQNNIEIHGVDRFVHNNAKFSISDLVSEYSYSSRTKKSLPVKQKEHQTDLFLSSGRLMIKLQEGCSRYCTFCIVPYLRGKPTSNTIDSIIDTIHSFGSNIKEVILTAVNTEYFGIENGETLEELIESIWARTSNIRIGFGSIHPWSLTDTFISWYKNQINNNRFVHYFHIPLQSGCDETLKRMNRRYKIDEIIHKIALIKHANPNIQIGTDIIVGFPGESDLEFKNTVENFQHSSIDRYHIFRYSPRLGTAAFKAGKRWGEVSYDIKQRRSDILHKIGRKNYSKFLSNQIGRTISSLLLKEKSGGMFQALGNNYLPIRINNTMKTSGTLINIRITDSSNEYCIGEEEILSDV